MPRDPRARPEGTGGESVQKRLQRSGAERDVEFAAFMAAHLAGLQRYGYLLTGSPSEAEDLVQEALVRVYEAWRRISIQGAPLAYTRTAMARTHISRWRALTRRAAVEDRACFDRSLVVEDPDWASTPVDRDRTWDLLALLAPRQRAVVVLRFYEELPLERIAAVLGCSPGTARSQLSRALATLRRNPAALELVSELVAQEDVR